MLINLFVTIKLLIAFCGINVFTKPVPPDLDDDRCQVRNFQNNHKIIKIQGDSSFQDSISLDTTRKFEDSLTINYSEDDNNKMEKRGVGMARNWLRTREMKFHGDEADENSTIELHHTRLPWGEKRRKDQTRLLIPQPPTLPNIGHIPDPPFFKTLFGS